jgi:hypothetical protein
MFSYLRESTAWTFALFGRFLFIVWFGMIALTEWLKGFALVDKWFFTVFLGKVVIILVGMLMTSIPLWILFLISFLPVSVIGPLFFIAFIVMLSQ